MRFLSLAVLLWLSPGCASALLLHPSTRPFFGSVARRSIEWDRGAVDVVITRSRGARDRAPAFFDLEFIGNASRAERVAPRLASRFGSHAVEVWTVNYPGYGESDGEADLDAIAPVARAVFDRMKEEAGARPCLVGGSSMGTTAALHLAANRAVDGVLLRNPPPLEEMILRRHGWWNLWLLAVPVVLQIPNDLDSVDTAARAHAPAVFLTSENDDVVPAEYQTLVVDAYAGPKVRVRYAGGHDGPVDAAAARAWEDAVGRMLGELGSN